MSPAEIHYEKALLFARLSYLGIIFPPAGLTLSIVCHYMLKDLKPTTVEEDERLRHAERLGHWGGVVSIWPIWAMLGGLIAGIIAALLGKA